MSSPAARSQPNPANDERLNFGGALDAVARGRRVTKLEWNDAATYLHLSGGILKIHKGEDDKDYNLTVSEGDIIGTDWIAF